MTNHSREVYSLLLKLEIRKEHKMEIKENNETNYDKLFNEMNNIVEKNNGFI